jgi:hypothetical protein
MPRRLSTSRKASSGVDLKAVSAEPGGQSASEQRPARLVPGDRHQPRRRHRDRSLRRRREHLPVVAPRRRYILRLRVGDRVSVCERWHVLQLPASGGGTWICIDALDAAPKRTTELPADRPQPFRAVPVEMSTGEGHP